MFFTAVDPMDKNCVGQEEYNVTQLRLAAYEQIWKIIQDAVYWVIIGRAQDMGLKFFQTRSNAIFLHDTLPPSCMEKVMSRKLKEILYTKTESKWRKDLDSKAFERTVQPVILRSFASRGEQPSHSSQ